MIKVLGINKKINYNFNLIDNYEVGISLKGSEIKSLRNKEFSINEAFIIIKKNEAYIINMYIAKYKLSTNTFSKYNQKRTRKLLLHKKEIKKIEKKIKLEKVIVVPKKVYLKNNFCKIEIFTAKPKKTIDKRQTIKKREMNLEVKKQLKNRY